MTTDLTIDILQKQFDDVLKITGEDSYVNWQAFSKGSNEVISKLDSLNNKINALRQQHQKNFIQTMRKLKSFDIPDVIKSVKSKKLPKQALKTILSRFKLVEGNIQLVQGVEKLRENSNNQYQSYTDKNKSISNLISNTITSFQNLIEQGDQKPQTQISTQQVQINQEQQKILSALKQKFNFSNQALNNHSKDIKLEYYPSTKFISVKTYGQIIQAAENLVRESYHKLTIQTRKRQRAEFKNPDKYVEILKQYITDTQLLIMKGQSALAGKLGFSQVQLQMNEEFLMQRGEANNLLIIQSLARNRLKESLPATRTIDLQQTKEILNLQLRLINQKSEYLREIFSFLPKSMQTAQLIPLLLALILNDFVYFEKQCQEEDYIKHISEEAFIQNPELNGIFQKMESAIIQLMQKIDLIPKDIAQYMQQGGQVPPGFLPPGQQMPNFPPEGMIPPGMDPMTFLQLQQMQAAQYQMYNQQKP